MLLARLVRLALFLALLLPAVRLEPAAAQGTPSPNVSLWAPSGGPVVKRAAGFFAVARPDDGNRLVVGAGAYVFRSDDGGATWDNRFLMDVTRRTAEEDAQPLIQQLLPDPGNYDRLYAVIGVYRGGQRAFEIWRSDDAGRTWPRASSVPPVPGTAPRLALAGDGSVYLAMEARVYRSTDRAATWSEVTGDLGTSDRIAALAVSPNDPNVLLVGFDHPGYTGETALVARTDNGGAHWRLINVALGSPLLSSGTVISLTFSPADANRVYATHSRHGLMASADGGLTWTRWEEGVADVVYGTYLRSVVADPADASTAWALAGRRGQTSTTLYRTADGGRTWTAQLNGIEKPTVGFFEAVGAGGGHTYLVSAVSVYRSDNRGDDWAPAYDWRLGEANVRQVVAGARSRTLYAVTGDSLYRSANRGASWSAQGRLPAQTSTFELSVDGADPATVYAFHDGGTYGNRRLSTSTDGGKTWSAAQTLPKYLDRLMAVPGRSATLLATGEPGYNGGDAPMVRSTDGGKTWSNLFAEYAKTVLLTVDGGDLSTLYAALATKSYPRTYPMFRSTDGGATWTQTGGTFEFDSARGVVIGGGRVIVNTGSGSGDTLKVSLDAGRTWTDQVLPPPGFPGGAGAVTQLAVEADRPGVFHALRETRFGSGNGGELWTSRDGAATWQLETFLGGSTPSYGAKDALIANAGRFALLNSWDGGPIWRATGNDNGAAPINQPAAPAPAPTVPAGPATPNPPVAPAASPAVLITDLWTADDQDNDQSDFRPGDTVRLHLAFDAPRPTPARVDMSVFDAAGNRVEALSEADDMTLDPAQNDIVLTARIPRNQAPGTYTFRGSLTVGGDMQSLATTFRIVR